MTLAREGREINLATAATVLAGVGRHPRAPCWCWMT